MANPMRTLALFVHGIGTSNDFWGVTCAALQSDRRLREKGITVEFWGYDTHRRPVPSWRRPLALLTGQRRLQTLDQLGSHLWSDLLRWPESFDIVLLFGHSMGGLVIAAAIGNGLGRSTDNDLAAKVAGVAFCATPLGGASLAGRASPLFRAFGENVQVRDLAKDSRSRKEIVTRFVNSYLLGDSPRQFAIFRAAGDEVVEESELYGEFPRRYRPPRPIVLRGSHNESLKDLTLDSPNLDMIVNWLCESITVQEKRADNFDTLVVEIKREFLEGGVFASWRPPSDELRDVSKAYLVRVAFQKLLHMASRIHPAVVSTNLWVLHSSTEQGGQYLRSDEREGHFTLRQLVDPNLGGVRYRATVLSYNMELLQGGLLSAAARAVVEKRVVFVDVKSTEFNSQPEIELGTSLIIGIPCPTTQRGLENPGDPMSITIDIAASLEQRDRDALEHRAVEIRDLFGAIASFRSEERGGTL